MNARARGAGPAPGSSVSEQVYRHLLSAILDGIHPPGTRLPAERVLAGTLGASRVAVREALGRLQSARLVDTRHGSGATVQPRHRWTALALGPSLARCLRAGDLAALAPLALDALALRRSLLLDLLERAAPALAGQRLHAARDWVARAWAARDDRFAFFASDREVIPLALEAAGMLASVWTLNALADAYLDVMVAVGGGLVVPGSYRDDHEAVLVALEAGDGPGARDRFSGYLDALDAAILAALPASP